MHYSEALIFLKVMVGPSGALGPVPSSPLKQSDRSEILFPGDRAGGSGLGCK